MAYLESAVVVYLREIYYPQGFHFPLTVITPSIYLIEIGREIATIIMLYSFSYFMSKNKIEFFAFFGFNFALWDIWYYIWLKILINWPESILTWDILFLIPIPWIAPVLAPILVSGSLIISALIILDCKNQFKFSLSDWIIEILAGILIIVSFLFQTNLIQQNMPPENFPWLLFVFGLLLGLVWFFLRIQQVRKRN